jgi:2-amino-4-hydroxy-6-hydroxymethyldihydropteridine diphosphokinase
MNKISKLSKFFSTKNQAIIALGSNMGNRFQNISKATEYLRKYNNVIKTSQIYENPCLDNSNNVLGNESNFFNAAVQIETTLSCQDLLQYCKTIERVNIK